MLQLKIRTSGFRYFLSPDPDATAVACGALICVRRDDNGQDLNPKRLSFSLFHSSSVFAQFLQAQAFPFDVRHEKMPVIGCGNSELSEKMCCYGFRDVPSVNTSESAMGQTAEREWKRNFPADTTCRCSTANKNETNANMFPFSDVLSCQIHASGGERARGRKGGGGGCRV